MSTYALFGTTYALAMTTYALNNTVYIFFLRMSLDVIAYMKALCKSKENAIENSYQS